MALRLHLDEHVPHAVAVGLRRRGIDVTTTVDVGLMGTSDLSHIEFARTQVRVIYTQDEDFLTLSASRVEHAGVVYNAPEARTVRQIIEFLQLLVECMSRKRRWQIT